MSDERSERKKLADATHAGFTITCDVCTCDIVIIESSIGYSKLSGQWGSVDLVCANCLNRTEIYE